MLVVFLNYSRLSDLPCFATPTCCYCRAVQGGVVCDAGRWRHFQALAFLEDSFYPTGAVGIEAEYFSSRWQSLVRKEYPLWVCRPRAFSRKFSRHFRCWKAKSSPRCGMVSPSETRLSTCFGSAAVLVERELFPALLTSPTPSPATLLPPRSPALRLMVFNDACGKQSDCSFLGEYTGNLRCSVNEVPD